jgi:predicted nucleic acid-binding protein
VRFVDTNVLLYAISREPGEQQKREIANDLLRARDLALSVQVLQEFYVQATRSSRADALPHEQASRLVEAFARFPVQPVTLPLVMAATEAHMRFQLSYWDAAIIEAARLLGCSEVLSEDLQHGRQFGDLRVANPFR